MITKKDLKNKDSSGEYINGISIIRNAIMLCPKCFAEYSSDFDDYFGIDPNWEFLCNNCQEPLILAVPEKIYHVIKT